MNIFVATSPFQYICANEARVAYKTQNNILFLVKQNREPGISQLNHVFCEQDWDHVIWVERHQRTLNVPKAIKKAISINHGNASFDRFFYAEYNAWRTKLIRRNLNFNQEIYFDDGTTTVFEYELYIREEKTFYRPRFVQDLLLMLQGLKPIGKLEHFRNFEIFSIFKLLDPIHKSRTNHFSALKDKYGNRKIYDKESPIGFLGHGAVGGKNGKCIQTYLDEVSQFMQYVEHDVLYFPHRTELSEVAEQLKQLPRLKYHASTLPLEVELLDKEITLSGLYGTYSNAQYSISVLYPDVPVYNLIPSGKGINTTRQDSYTVIHRLFEKIAIPNIQI
ncbi:putative uncharacterized protein [Aliivibrio wodanis]|uniref:Glycosyltransferase 52 family protein n=1 Tax=Aliivibrio wodanis TaxID=80852 RepID=A0A090IPP8_9GAMM|nr:putative uncharacterized protein [Aliivibrio wodanis]